MVRPSPHRRSNLGSDWELAPGAGLYQPDALDADHCRRFGPLASAHVHLGVIDPEWDAIYWNAIQREADRRVADLGARKSRISAAISSTCVSSAKWPVSKKRTTAPGMSRLNASAPGGRKKGSFLPQTARSG